MLPAWQLRKRKRAFLGLDRERAGNGARPQPPRRRSPPASANPRRRPASARFQPSCRENRQEIRGRTGRFPPEIRVARDERWVTFRLSPVLVQTCLSQKCESHRVFRSASKQLPASLPPFDRETFSRLFFFQALMARLV